MLDGRKLWTKASKYWCVEENSKRGAENLCKQFELECKELENLPIKELCGKGPAHGNGNLKEIGVKINKYRNDLSKLNNDIMGEINDLAGGKILGSGTGSTRDIPIS